MEPFKVCSCGTAWNTRQDLMADPEVEITGYFAVPDDLELGAFTFNHHHCRSTVAVYAREFVGLYDGPTFENRLTGGSKCPGHCLRESDLSSCSEACECAYVREVIQIVRQWPKDGLVASNIESAGNMA